MMLCVEQDSLQFQATVQQQHASLVEVKEGHSTVRIQHQIARQVKLVLIAVDTDDVSININFTDL